jgi:hypothetical protein
MWSDNIWWLNNQNSLYFLGYNNMKIVKYFTLLSILVDICILAMNKKQNNT